MRELRGAVRSPGVDTKQVPGLDAEVLPTAQEGEHAAPDNRGYPEENLTLTTVLAKYSGGPQSGVFTDGSAVPNPGPGGWGVVWVENGEIVDQRYGKSASTTTVVEGRVARVRDRAHRASMPSCKQSRCPNLDGSALATKPSAVAGKG